MASPPLGEAAAAAARARDGWRRADDESLRQEVRRLAERRAELAARRATKLDALGNALQAGHVAQRRRKAVAAVRAR